MTVQLEQIALRTSAWVELHATLASEGAYDDALRNDLRGDALADATRAVARCGDDRCALTALEGTRFARPFAAALPAFVSARWHERAVAARAGIDRVRTAWRVEVAPLVARLADDLAVEWPDGPVVVDVVAQAPPAAREALVPVVLGARGSCFVASSKEAQRLRDARVIDCVLGYAAMSLAERSAIYQELSAALGERRARRAFELLAIHAVAATVRGWERSHVSSLRRSANAVEREALVWLAESWPARAGGEAPRFFARRYAKALGAIDEGR
jgi:hypothetical protein